jgi:putative ABC transport system substrate-binding protein
VVLTSEGTAPYLEAVEGFRAVLLARLPGAVLEVRTLEGSPAPAAAPRGAAPDLVVTLGSRAAAAAVSARLEAPVVAGMVLKPSELAAAPGMTGVHLEFPVEVELEWLRRILPGQRHVGVLFNPAENAGKVERATRAARTLDLRVHARQVEAPAQIQDGLDRLGARRRSSGGSPMRWS